MVANISNYQGREQAYIKHLFLSDYLEKLVFKTASKYDTIVYVDGYSGPWQSTGEAFSDTSFGIALAALRKAKATWKTLGRDVRMIAVLVETSSDSFAQLSRLPLSHPDIDIRPLHGDFISLAPIVSRRIPAQAFTFLFIDPKGWRIPMSKLSDLLSRPNTEVVFNFMFDFINRAASMNEEGIVRGLNELIPFGDWRQKLAALPRGASSNAEQRKAILVAAFSETLRQVGNYSYVAETPILRPLKDRTLYSLIYGTRKPAGMEVFRDCQIEALKAQGKVRGTTKLAKEADSSGQQEMFGSLSDMAPSEVDQFLQTERELAKRLLIELCPSAPDQTTYGSVWPVVLARHAIRKTELSAIANSERKAGSIIFPFWPDRKKVPEDDYSMHKPPAI